MAKPIAVIFIPADLTEPDGIKVTWADCTKTTKKLEKDKPDYHWFVLLQNDISGVQFHVFYEKDFTEIQYAELKKIIEDAVEKENTQSS